MSGAMAREMNMVGVAQLVSAPDCGSGGRGFESLHPPHSFLQASPLAGLKISVASNIGMSPSGKATDFDSVMRRFESCHPSQINDPLAQSAEHLPFKQGVRSSNLRRVTKIRNAYAFRIFCLFSQDKSLNFDFLEF